MRKSKIYELTTGNELPEAYRLGNEAFGDFAKKSWDSVKSGAISFKDGVVGLADYKKQWSRLKNGVSEYNRQWKSLYNAAFSKEGYGQYARDNYIRHMAKLTADASKNMDPEMAAMFKVTHADDIVKGTADRIKDSVKDTPFKQRAGVLFKDIFTTSKLNAVKYTAIAGALVATLGTAYAATTYVIRKKRFNALYGVINQAEANLKKVGAGTITTTLDQDVLLEMIKGVGIVTYTGGSVRDIGRYITSVDLDRFYDEVIVMVNDVKNGRIKQDGKSILQQVLKLNVAFNPMNEEIMRNMNNIDKLLLEQPTKARGNFMVSNAISGLYGYILNPIQDAVEPIAFMSPEVKCNQLGDIFFTATADDLMEVTLAVKEAIGKDEENKNKLTKLSNDIEQYINRSGNNGQPFFNDEESALLAAMILQAAMMSVNDYFSALPDSLQNIAAILSNYTNNLSIA